MLNDSAIKIIRELKIEGGCNVQFALNPNSSEYFLIEVNPRVSRSSALASKASGYPIARVTAKIAVGMALEDIKIANTTAAFEPSLDYVVAKLPRFPFDKFASAANTLGTQMKATGDVMGIGANLEECLLKSVRSLEIGVCHFYMPKFDRMDTAEILEYLKQFRDDTIFAVAELLRRNVSVDAIYEVTQITPFFIRSIEKIVNMEMALKANVGDTETLKQAKAMGFGDKFIAQLWGMKELEVYRLRCEKDIFPAHNIVAAKAHNDHVQHTKEKLHAAVKQSHGLVKFPFGGLINFVGCVKAVNLRLLVGKGLGGADAGQAAFDLLIDVARLFLGCCGCSRHPLAHSHGYR